MIEPIVVHRTQVSSIHDIDILLIGSIWAVVDFWPEESNWKFFSNKEWQEVVKHYKSSYDKTIRDERVDKIYGEYWDTHHEIIEYDELEKRYKEEYGEELYEDKEI